MIVDFLECRWFKVIYRDGYKETDYLKLHPTFSDFNAIANNPRSYFPYKSIVLPGNYSELVSKIIRPRGFSKVLLPLPYRLTIKKVMISLLLLSYGNLINSNLKYLINNEVVLQ